MTARKPPKLYGVYLGKDREFPKNQVLEYGKVYEIDFIPPTDEFKHFMMYVHASRWSLYVPYPNEIAIWKDWMPYDGRKPDVQPETEKELDARRLEEMGA